MHAIPIKGWNLNWQGLFRQVEARVAMKIRGYQRTLETHSNHTHKPRGLAVTSNRGWLPLEGTINRRTPHAS